MAELKIRVPLDDDGKFAEEDSKITEITWESDPERHTNQTEEGAKDMVGKVCNWVLDMNLG
jgi:hypothetical protein